jgi:hypothetical protein
MALGCQAQWTGLAVGMPSGIVTKITRLLGVGALPIKCRRNPPMITDPEALQRIRESWKTVRILQAKIDTTMSAHPLSLLPAMTNFRVVPESLLLVFATSVLEDTLRQLQHQGIFGPKEPQQWGLGRLIVESRGTLCWQDYGKIQEIKNRRNDVAHKRAFPPSDKCAEYLNAIAKELMEWRVLEHDFKGEYGVSFQPTSEYGTAVDDTRRRAPLHRQTVQSPDDPLARASLCLHPAQQACLAPLTMWCRMVDCPRCYQGAHKGVPLISGPVRWLIC